jgi:hypothetical protein
VPPKIPALLKGTAVFENSAMKNGHSNRVPNSKPVPFETDSAETHAPKWPIVIASTLLKINPTLLEKFLLTLKILHGRRGCMSIRDSTSDFEN